MPRLTRASRRSAAKKAEVEEEDQVADQTEELAVEKTVAAAKKDSDAEDGDKPDEKNDAANENNDNENDSANEVNDEEDPDERVSENGETKDNAKDVEDEDDVEEDEEEDEEDEEKPTRARRASSARKTNKADTKPQLEPLSQGKGGKLRKRLEAWHKELEQREQLDEDEDSSELDHMARELIRPLVLKCKENTVLLLAGCCFADILHIYAPDPPYLPEEIKTVFEFLVDRLRGLQQKPGSTTYALSFYILQKLALCRSSCILVELTDADDDPLTSEDLIVSLVEAMFDIMVPTREHSVEAYALELLVGLFDEMDRFSPRVLDALLVKLLPEYQKESPKAFELAVKVIRQLSDRLREPLSALLNGFVSGIRSARASDVVDKGRARKKMRKSLNGDSDEDMDEGDDEEGSEAEDNDHMLIGGNNEEEATATEVKDNVYEIIFQLFRVDPSLLLYTLPHVAAQLEASDEEARREAVGVVGRIFCQVDRQSLLSDNSRLWAAFLRRILDVDSGIRLSLVSFAGFALNRSEPSKPGSGNSEDNDEDEDENENGVSSVPHGDTSESTLGAGAGANFWVKHFISPNFHAEYAKTLESTLLDPSKHEPSFLELALNDKDVNVRREAVEVVVAFISRPGVLRQFKRFDVHDSLVRALSMRLCDKRVDLATSALEGLAKCFNAGLVEPYWVPQAELENEVNEKSDRLLENESNEDGPSEDSEAVSFSNANKEMRDEPSEMQTFAEEVLEWIPHDMFLHVLHQRAHDDTLMYRLTLCSVMDSVILGRRKHRNLKVRAWILARVWSKLEDIARNAFGLIMLKQRGRLVGLLSQVTQAREAMEGKSTRRGRRSLGQQQNQQQSTEEAAATTKGCRALKQLAQEFVPSVRCPDAATKLVNVWDLKDKHVFRDLKIIGECRGADPDQVADAETDLIQRLGSKSETARAARVLTTRLMATTFGELEMLELLGVYARIVAKRGDDAEVENLCSLIEATMSEMPELIGVEAVKSSAWILALAEARFCHQRKGNDETQTSSEARSDQVSSQQKKKQQKQQQQRRRSSRNRRSTASAGSSAIEEETDVTSNLTPTKSVQTSALPIPTMSARQLQAYEKLSDHSLENLCIAACNVASAAAAKDGPLPDESQLERIFRYSGRVDCVKSASKAWALHVIRETKLGTGQNNVMRARFKEVLKDAIEAVKTVLREKRRDSNTVQCTLSVLKALIKLCPEFAAEADIDLFGLTSKVFEYVRHPFSKKRKDGTPASSSPSPASQALETAKAKVLGIKFICYEILRRVRDFDPDDLTELRKLVLLMRKFVSDSGDPWCREQQRKASGSATKTTPNKRRKSISETIVWPPSEDESFVQLRLYSAKALIKLEARCPGGPARDVLREANEKQQSHQREIQRWVELSWIALDPDEAAREAFVATLYKEFITRGRELFRYGAFFPLAAALRPKGAAHGHMTQLLRFLQRTYQAKTERAALLGRGENLNIAAQFAPENMVSTLIYLVAHHPQMPIAREAAQDFVSSLAGQRALIKPLVTLFDGLSSVAPQHNTNAGLLYALLEVMRRHTDALNPGCDNIHMIGEICQLLIKHRMKVSPDLLEYPGGIMLPKMYVAVQATPLRQHNDIASPGMAPVTPRNSSKATERSAQRQRRSYQNGAMLPANFELRVGAGSGGAALATSADESFNFRRKRVRPVASRTGSSSNKQRKQQPQSHVPPVTPTRRQPSRSTKTDVGYADVEHSDDDMSEE